MHLKYAYVSVCVCVYIHIYIQVNISHFCLFNIDNGRIHQNDTIKIEICFFFCWFGDVTIETCKAENTSDIAVVVMLLLPVQEFYFCEESIRKVFPPFAFTLELHFHEVKIPNINRNCRLNFGTP